MYYHNTSILLLKRFLQTASYFDTLGQAMYMMYGYLDPLGMYFGSLEACLFEAYQVAVWGFRE